MLVGNQRINAAGHLEIGGCDTLSLAQQFGTPLYVVDEQEVRRRCHAFKQAFSDAWLSTEVSYAGKAFLPLAMCRLIDEEGLGLDVASGGELYCALAAGFPAGRISLHGNNKSAEELRMAVEAGVGHIVVDNLMEMEILRGLVSPARPIRAQIRVRPGIDPHTHRRIRTGQADSKFGMGISDGGAMLGIETALGVPGLELAGLHCHVGSQLLDMSAHIAAVEIMAEFIAEVKAALHWIPLELNVGGGFGIRYEAGHNPPTAESAARIITETLRQELGRHGIPEPTLMIEPGRAIIGEAGTTLYSIGAIKQVSIPDAPFQRLYVAVDGGMSDNPRPQLYDARYSALIADRAGVHPDRTVTVVGKHCETDVLIWDIPLDDPRPGDVLAVQCTGAYNHSMSSNYNRLTRPAVVFVHDSQAEVVVRRETYADLIASEIIPERLMGNEERCCDRVPATAPAS